MLTVRPFLGFLFFLTTLTVWRLWPAFAQPDMALGTVGDAAGTIGWIWEIGRQFDTEGWAVFLNGDVLKSTFFGAGLMDPVPVMNPAWRLLYVGVTRLGLSPDNNYDAVIAIQFLVAGLIGWFFAASFGLKSFWRFIFVFLMLSVENTSIRIAGHNGLVFLYGPLLALMTALKFAQQPSQRRALALAFTLWLSFLSNEYFGYFSLWACLALIISHDWAALRTNFKSYAFRQAQFIWPAALCFVVLVCCSHPSVSLFKLTNLWEQWTNPSAIEISRGPALRESNHAREFLMYGLKNPLAVLESWLIPIPTELNQKIFGRNTHEFTFRWGLILPAFIWWTLRVAKNEPRQVPFKGLIFTVVAVTFLVGMRTDVGLSLGWVTRVIAPMFRVGVRSQFISLVLMLLLFVLCAQWLWDTRKKEWGALRLSAALLTVFGLSTVELARSGPIIGQHAVFPISGLTPLAQALAHEPAGLTLLVPALDGHRESESYFLASAHGLPVLNSQFGQRDFEYRSALFTAADSPSEAAKSQLQACGIRYLVESQPMPANEGWQDVAGVRLVTENAFGRIFELPEAQAWPVALGASLTAEVDTALREGRSFLKKCIGNTLNLSTGGAARP